MPKVKTVAQFGGDVERNGDGLTRLRDDLCYPQRVERPAYRTFFNDI